MHEPQIHGALVSLPGARLHPEEITVKPVKWKCQVYYLRPVPTGPVQCEWSDYEACAFWVTALLSNVKALRLGHCEQDLHYLRWKPAGLKQCEGYVCCLRLMPAGFCSLQCRSDSCVIWGQSLWYLCNMSNSSALSGQSLWELHNVSSTSSSISGRSLHNSCNVFEASAFMIHSIWDTALLSKSKASSTHAILVTTLICGQHGRDIYHDS